MMKDLYKIGLMSMAGLALQAQAAEPVQYSTIKKDGEISTVVKYQNNDFFVLTDYDADGTCDSIIGKRNGKQYFCESSDEEFHSLLNMILEDVSHKNSYNPNTLRSNLEKKIFNF